MLRFHWLAIPLVCALLLLLSPALFAQTPPAASKTCSFHGRISDTVGAAINRAFVLVYSDRLEKVSRQVSLNEYAEFAVELEPGLYDLFTASPGFVPVAKIINIRTCKPVDLKLKMQVDMEHMED